MALFCHEICCTSGYKPSLVRTVAFDQFFTLQCCLLITLNCGISHNKHISTSCTPHREDRLQAFVFCGPRVLEIICDSSQSCAFADAHVRLLSKPSQGDKQNPRISRRDAHHHLRKLGHFNIMKFFQDQLIYFIALYSYCKTTIWSVSSEFQEKKLTES